MPKKEHHQRINKLLNKMDTDFLIKNQCYFGGGTAIALQLDDYRLSTDVDFICASAEGYRAIRGMIETKSLGPLFKENITLARDVYKDQYGIRTAIAIEGVPIKFEVVREGRINLSSPEFSPNIPVPLVNRQDLYTLKLLANDDRGLDKSFSSRDLIDLAAMKHNWGEIPDKVWEKVEQVYGQNVHVHFDKSRSLLADDSYLFKCLDELEMDSAWGTVIVNELDLHQMRIEKRKEKYLDNEIINTEFDL